VNLKFPPILFSILISILLPLQGAAAVLCIESAEKDGLSLNEVNIEMGASFFLTKKSKLSNAWQSLIKTLSEDMKKSPDLINKERKETEKYLSIRFQQVTEALKLSDDLKADLLLILGTDTSIPRTKKPGPVAKMFLPSLGIYNFVDNREFRMEIDPAHSLLNLIKVSDLKTETNFVEAMKSRAISLSAAKLLANLNTSRAWKNFGLLYITSKEDLRNSPSPRQNGYNSFDYELTKIASTNNRLDPNGQKELGLYQAREILEKIMDTHGIPLENSIESIDNIILDIRAANIGA
tara:strand:+ start:8692 stop:9570 length:879 start_codon:yes stop_codon:yes gene_type:complete